MDEAIPLQAPALPIAVLGLGGVGGVIAARTGALCVASARTAAVIAADGLRLEHDGAVTVTRPRVVELLAEPVALLVVAVKAYDLQQALDRVDLGILGPETVVLPLLNGLEHVSLIRSRVAATGVTVVAGSISRFEGVRTAPGALLQRSRGALVTVGSDVLSKYALGRAVAPLRVPGIGVVLSASEAAVLWGKAARLAVLAAATVGTGATIGELRDDSGAAAELRAALAEACAAAAADGVPLDVEAQWALVEGLPAEFTTSAARDAQAGRRSELDSIAGSVIRAATRLGIATPALTTLVERAGTTP